jgi:hypothetical protein
MKLNYRDKMILIVVFVLLIIVAGFMLFHFTQVDYLYKIFNHYIALIGRTRNIPYPTK